MAKGLPEICYGTLETTGETIIIKAGETGYVKSEDQRPADDLNEILEVTKAEKKAMEWGSMYGWDTPGANPDRYNEDGIPKKKEVN
ncbi:hypothetical protein CN495_07765 [Bacillus thuringiensis]|uniref:Uncharacterized protein n=1 Tax=Bacillus thuringiensis TaxID=1428 RepID=A0ABD6S830_BACTU|nr:hypothetical protein [Bacillus thuringiensis]PER55641.1 hypothetical protein CN495_07765 [Bacillus thuringiensis]